MPAAGGCRPAARLLSSADNKKEFGTMPLEGPEAAAQVPPNQKTIWRKPTVTTLDAWEAEAQDGAGTDASGFLS
jgi:hypothetical protein